MKQLLNRLRLLEQYQLIKYYDGEEKEECSVVHEGTQEECEQYAQQLGVQVKPKASKEKGETAYCIEKSDRPADEEKSGTISNKQMTTAKDQAHGIEEAVEGSDDMEDETGMNIQEGDSIVEMKNAKQLTEEIDVLLKEIEETEKEAGLMLDDMEAPSGMNTAVVEE